MAQPTAGTAQVPAAPQGTFPQFRTDTYASQLVWLAITFAVLYYLMSKVALPRVAAILAARRNRIEADLAEAAAARKNAEDAGVLHEKTLAEARAKSQAMAQQTHEKLAAETDAKRKALEADLNARLTDAEGKIATIKAQAMGNVDAIARESAAAIVERITGRSPDPAAVSRAVDQAVAAKA
jgi:F-type H+-transporting ATPase subunit b